MEKSDSIFSQNSPYKQIKQDDLVFEVKQTLRESLTKILSDSSNIGKIIMFEQLRGVKDETKKFLIKDRRGRKIAFALCSPPTSPEIVARGIECSRLAKQAIGSELECHIIKPLYEGKVYGMSYVLFPYCQPLSNLRLRWYGQRFLLSPPLFRFLTRITEATVKEVHSDKMERDFIVPLKHLAELETITDRVRAGALQTLERITNKTWSPRYVLMHSDLWKGNILLQHLPTSSMKNKLWGKHFVITDWAGSTLEGYGIYDLVRLAQSLNLKPKQLRENVITHCLILGCDFADARCHLLSALGYLSMHLEYFPLPRFIQLADSCLETLEEIGG